MSLSFTKIPTTIAGCYVLDGAVHQDFRGTFFKSFQESSFIENGLETNFKEDFCSRSKKGVIRGLHFQVPPKDHAKMIYCLSGSVFDVGLDLRVDSPTYGQFITQELSADDGQVLYLAKGIAHGFQALTDDAVLVYKVSSEYSPDHDKGIHWNSAGIPWPINPPVLSIRDSNFPAFSDFKSPFYYGKS